MEYRKRSRLYPWPVRFSQALCVLKRRKAMRHYSLLIIALVTIVGCAGSPTQKGYEQMLQSWQGADINALIAKWGPPSRTDELQNGNKMYTYNKYQTTSGYSPRGTPSTTTVNVYGNTAPARTTPSCSVSFTTDSSQRVTAWRYEGNSCRAQERQ